jgi:hypothetical protein
MPTVDQNLNVATNSCAVEPENDGLWLVVPGVTRVNLKIPALHEIGEHSDHVFSATPDRISDIFNQN